MLGPSFTRARTHTHTHQHQTMEAADTELLSRSQLWLILLMKRSQEETAATTEATKQIQKPKPSTPRQMDGISRKVSLTLLLWRQRNKLSRCSQVFADDRLLLLHRRDVASLPRRYWREESLQQSATEERHAWNVDSKPGAWVSLPLWLHCPLHSVCDGCRRVKWIWRFLMLPLWTARKLEFLVKFHFRWAAATL